MSEKLVLIDGHSILNRAFYGVPDLTNSSGMHTNAIYGFLNILFKILEEEKPNYLAVAFDVKHPTFRHEMYDGYKAQRKGMPEELAAQMEYAHKVVRALGFHIIEKEGYEADDILGTLAAACEQRGDECVLATGDRDSLQLVRDNVTVLLATTKAGGAMYTAMTRT